MNVREAVYSNITEHELIGAGDRVLIGLSGGADSVCLLTVLNELRERLHFELGAMHINHGLRKEAGEDEAYSKELCEKYGISFYSERIDVVTYADNRGLSTEEAGRILRYEAFDKCMIINGYNKLATAHHANDLAETMLLFLARGTGIKGLNPIKYKNGIVIRPLLSVSKQDILAFLEEEGIKHCEDLTNSDNDYTRNYIRNEIIPRLEEVNDKAVDHMVRTADIVSEAYDIIEDELNRLEETYIRRENNEYTVCLETKLLKPYMFKSLIHRAIAKAAQAEKDITAAHIEAVASLMDKQVGKMVDLPYNLKARREYDGILIKSADSYGVYSNEHAITYKTRAFIRQDGLNIPEKEYTKWFDYDIIKDTFIIRPVDDNDEITVLKNGGTKKVKELFKDLKVPIDKRKSYMCVAQGNHVYWIIGLRMGEDAKITENTKTILEIDISEVER